MNINSPACNEHRQSIASPSFMTSIHHQDRHHGLLHSISPSGARSSSIFHANECVKPPDQFFRLPYVKHHHPHRHNDENSVQFSMSTLPTVVVFPRRRHRRVTNPRPATTTSGTTTTERRSSSSSDFSNVSSATSEDTTTNTNTNLDLDPSNYN